MIQTFCGHCNKATTFQETTFDEFFRKLGGNGLRENYPDIYMNLVLNRPGIAALGHIIDDKTLLKICLNPLEVFECEQCGHYHVTFQGG